MILRNRAEHANVLYIQTYHVFLLLVDVYYFQYYKVYIIKCSTLPKIQDANPTPWLNIKNDDIEVPDWLPMVKP